MSESFVTVERHGVTSVVTIRRPPANAIELTSARQLHRAILTLHDDAHVKAIVLTGTGDCFSAGLDLKVIPRYDREEQRAMVRSLGKVVLALYGSRKPLIAAVNGHAVAAGTLFTLCADYRIGPDNGARFGLTGVRVGIPYPDAALEVITTEMGMTASRATLLRALTFNAESALARGILDEIVAPERVIPRALEVADDLVKMPAENYGNLKEQLRGKALARIRKSMDNDSALDAWL